MVPRMDHLPDLSTLVLDLHSAQFSGSEQIMNGTTVSDVDGEAAATNITACESWDAAFAYANELMGGPVTVKVAGDSTIYRITSDGKKRALCRVV